MWEKYRLPRGHTLQEVFTTIAGCQMAKSRRTSNFNSVTPRSLCRTELDLDALQLIWLRTEAEYKTLMHLLPAAAVKKHGPKFRHGKKPNLHFFNWSFVESASLEQNKISLIFNASTLTPVHSRLICKFAIARPARVTSGRVRSSRRTAHLLSASRKSRKRRHTTCNSRSTARSRMLTGLLRRQFHFSV